MVFGGKYENSKKKVTMKNHFSLTVGWPFPLFRCPFLCAGGQPVVVGRSIALQLLQSGSGRGTADPYQP